MAVHLVENMRVAQTLCSYHLREAGRESACALSESFIRNHDGRSEECNWLWR